MDSSDDVMHWAGALHESYRPDGKGHCDDHGQHPAEQHIRQHSQCRLTAKNGESGRIGPRLMIKVAGRIDPWLISPMPCSIPARPARTPKIAITTLVAFASIGAGRIGLAPVPKSGSNCTHDYQHQPIRSAMPYLPPCMHAVR